MNLGTVVFDELIHHIDQLYFADGALVIVASVKIETETILGGGIYQVFDPRGILITIGDVVRQSQCAFPGDSSSITIRFSIVDKMTKDMAEGVPTIATRL